MISAMKRRKQSRTRRIGRGWVWGPAGSRRAALNRAGLHDETAYNSGNFKLPFFFPLVAFVSQFTHFCKTENVVVKVSFSDLPHNRKCGVLSAS